MSELVYAVGIFLVVYVVIISEKVNRMVISLFGVALILLVGIMDLKRAVSHIDPDTLILLISMMIIVNILKQSGFFEYSAIVIAKMARGSVPKIMLSFSLLTAVASAFLDNVTTILLVVPVTIVIAKQLDVDPVYFIIPEVMMSNIGGTATLIGDPPNIMIGSQTGLGFGDFLYGLSPVVLLIVLVTGTLYYLIYRGKLVTDAKNWEKIASLNEKLAIKDKKLLIKSGIILSLTILGFLIGHSLGFEAATIALIGAATLLLISGVDAEEVILSIEWTTLFFFAGLFIMVGALVEVGAIEILAKEILKLTGSNLFLTAMIVLWASAIISAFLDNIPFVATMIPLIFSIGEGMAGVDIMPIWWALALGACLGGNGTIIGASANVIAVGILEKHKHKITFVDFMKVGMPTVIISIVLSSFYLIVRYL